MFVIVGIISLLIGIVIGTLVIIKKVVDPSFDEIRRLRVESAKHFDLYMLMNDWVHLHQYGKKIESYFQRNNYRKIAIYGMNYVGETLFRELQNTSIEVVVGIDRNAINISSEIDIITIDEYKHNVDAVVVTSIAYFDSISDSIFDIVKCPIVSIEDVIFEAGLDE